MSRWKWQGNHRANYRNIIKRYVTAFHALGQIPVACDFARAFNYLSYKYTIHDIVFTRYRVSHESLPIGRCIYLIKEIKNLHPQNYLYFNTNRIINTFLKGMK